MTFTIRYNNVNYQVNPEPVTTDERLDEALDSAKFSFISKDITTNIPPFTKMVITENSTSTHWFCSSECKPIVEMNGYYYHILTIIEATKISETWEVGTKSFSVIDGKFNYNKGWNRVEVLNRLVYAEYGINVYLTTNFKNLITSERAYSYSAGTTYFDIILDICKSNGCLPFISSISDDLKTYYFDAMKFSDLETNTITNISKIIEIDKNQSVDEYCDNIVTEMNSVVDRDNLSTWIGTMRSQSETIYKDNSVITLPSNCESVKSLYAKVKGKNGPCLRIPTRLLNLNNATYQHDVKTLSVDLSNWIDRYCDDYVRDMISEAIAIIEDELGYENGYYNEAFLYYEMDNFVLLLLWNNQNTGYDEGWLNLGILNEKQYGLLTTSEQPAYIYYKADSNVIDGFNSYKDNEFYNAIIFGQKGPFFKELYRLGTDTNYQRMMIYTDFEDDYYEYQEIDYRLSYFLMAWDTYAGSENATDYMYKVQYVANTSLGASIKKSIMSENETTWKKTTRSYNNGANTTDYNLLIPAMKKSANMLGLTTTSVTALDDIKVGTRTQFGYVISKQSNYSVINGNKVILSNTYNCCQNYNQIAEAIGVATQYEATNVPSKGIVKRFVTCEINMTSDIQDALNDDSNMIIMYIKCDDNATIGKVCTKKIKDDITYIIAEAEDNFTLDYQKISSNVTNYYKRNPVPYSNEDQCGDLYKMYLTSTNGDDYSKADFDLLPKKMMGDIITTTYTKSVYKDAREQIIFQFKIVEN